MLKTLYECSKTLQSKDQTGYGIVTVHWRVNFEDNDQWTITILPESDGKKPKSGEKLLVPELLRNADQPLLIDDAGEYVFGVGERGKKRQKLYLELLGQCWQETQDEAVKRVLDYVSSCDVNAIDEKIREQSKKNNPFCWERARFVFTYNSDRITYRPKVREFWVNYFIRQQDTIEGTCLLSGEKQLTLKRKMAQKIKGVPNTQSAGAALTSFDKDAYTSYGWDGNNNAPIGFNEAIAVHSFLNFLLTDKRFHYKQGNQVFVFWSEGFSLNSNFWDDPEEFWEDAQDKGAKIAEKLFQSIETGKLPRRDKPFYLAVLKGNKGRIAVSSWNETTADKIKTNIHRFIASQKEIKFTPNERAKPLWALKNCAFRDPRKEHTDSVELALIKAVLLGETLPDIYAMRVMDRICLEPIHEKKDWFNFCDRIKALSFYLSLLNKMTENSLSSPEKFAYYLGRIAFLMHRAQIVAQHPDSVSKKREKSSETDEKNFIREDSNVYRSLKALSTTPATVFPRLYYGCIANHLEDRDAQTKVGGMLFKLKTRLDEEFLKLGNYNPDTDLPKTLNVRQQAQFFIGFAQCRAEFFTKSESTQQEDN